MMAKRIKGVRRVVIKLGTRVLTTKTHALDIALIKRLVSEIDALLDKKRQVILVSSGAIGAGMGLLKRRTRPTELSQLQACAAIGQSHLVELYNNYFQKHQHIAAQILLTQDDLHHRQRYLNARNTLMQLVSLGVVPVVNENDTVSVDELRFGDNDILAAQVCSLVEADLLVILTDVEGLHHTDGSLVRHVTEITSALEKELIQDRSSDSGVGGMKSKLKAVKMVMRTGVPVVVAGGRRQNVLTDIFKGRAVGTLFEPRILKMKARKRWFAYSMRPRGEIKVDAGAHEALLKRGRSLLASGIQKVSGHFGAGDLVSICDMRGNEFARGLINLTHVQVGQIRGKRSSELVRFLGEGYGPEVIHRNNLVIL